MYQSSFGINHGNFHRRGFHRHIHTQIDTECNRHFKIKEYFLSVGFLGNCSKNHYNLVAFSLKFFIFPCSLEMKSANTISIRITSTVLVYCALQKWWTRLKINQGNLFLQKSLCSRWSVFQIWIYFLKSSPLPALYYETF